MDIDSLDRMLEEIYVQEQENNELVTVEKIPDEFHIVGIGTDAVVVQHKNDLERVFKVYAPSRIAKKELEFQVYQRLNNSPYFAKCYFKGINYLCLSYEQGPTLYECLELGIEIPELVVVDVELARAHARKVGLNPRDIHLKNVLLQNGHAKLIDVSEYVLPGDDQRWDHLVQGYRQFYSLIRGRKIPSWIINLVKKSYYSQVNEQFSVAEFVRKIRQLIAFK